MPVFDFPAAPTVDQTHTQNNVTYIWTGLVWNIVEDPLPIAGNNEARLGVVFVPDQRGLSLQTNGSLTLLPAGEYPQLGGFTEPPFDQGAHYRTYGNWVKVPDGTLPDDYGTGLSVDDTVSPRLVNLDPAGPTNLGGVFVPLRSATQGLAIDMGDVALGDPATGELTAPLATPLLAGAIVEPPPDDKGYVRTTHPNGVSQWVPPALAPPVIAGNAPKDLGAVYVPARNKHNQGLDLNADGGLYAPPATHEHLGAIVEPQDTNILYGRQRDATTGKADWQPIPQAEPAGHAPKDIGVVYVPARNKHNQGLDLNADGGLYAPPATYEHLGTIVEPPKDDKVYARTTNTTTGKSDWTETAGLVDYGIGLSYGPGADPGDPPIVNVTPAGLLPDFLGGVWVPPRTEFQGLEINTPTQPGMITAPPATDKLAGVFTEPPIGAGQLWARSNAGSTTGPVQGKWEPVFNIGTLTYQGAWKPATNDPNIHAVANKQSGDFWVVDCVDPMVEETPPVGSTPGLDGVMLKEGDWVIYNATADLWNHIVRQGLIFDKGLEQIGLVVNVTPATGTAIGGVIVPARNKTNQGLEIDNQGFLYSPPATHQHLGSIVEPPLDGIKYQRQTDLTTGKSDWVEADAAKIAGNAPANVGVVYVPARNKHNQGLDLNPDGGLYAPPATHEHLGTIVEPQVAGELMGRLRDGTTGKSDWAPVPLAKTAGNAPANIGGVYVPARNKHNQGLDLNPDGGLYAPPATHEHLGTIVEPQVADVLMGRLRSAAGDNTWEPVPLSQIAGNAPANIGVMYVPARNKHSQGLDLNPDGGLYAPPATHEHLGSILEPPEVGKTYARFRDPTTNNNQWLEFQNVIVATEPPPNVAEGQLWFDDDTSGLYLWYTDPTDITPGSGQWIQVNGQGGAVSGMLDKLPSDDVKYCFRNKTVVTVAEYGDVKDGLQPADHNGWIKLDGRSVGALTATQQAQANLLGFTTNIPNAQDCVARQIAGALGSVAGAWTISQAMLPAINTANSGVLTSSNVDFGALNTSTALGFSDNVGSGGSTGKTATGNSGYYFIESGGWNARNYSHSHTFDVPAHTHTVPAHAHSLGGSGSPFNPKTLVTVKFMFLGA